MFKTYSNVKDESPSPGSKEAQEKKRNMKLRSLKAKLADYALQGNVAKALDVAQRVFEIEPTDKTEAKIKKLQLLLDQENHEDDETMVDIGQGFFLFRDLHKQLYPYQVEGVKWMWWLFNKKKGGILGDDMGLGKTIQVISFLSGMFDADLLSTALIVMPVSLIPNWTKEFNKWAPGINVFQYYGTKRERQQCLAKVRRRGGVLLTTYGLLVTTNEELKEHNGRFYTWDYVILDEGHKIKTSTTKTSKAAHSVPAKNRLVLSGTPLQNNLKEMWALFDFVHHGTLLGTFRTFRCEYDVPITRARAKDATPSDKKLGLEIAESLRSLIQPYFLRRTKAEVLEKPISMGTPTSVREIPKLVRKNELVVWLYLSEAQQKIYSEFLLTDDVKQILMTKQSPLVQLTVLKKICDHPRLLSLRNCIKLGLEGERRVDETEDEIDEESYKTCIDHVTDENLLKESGKLLFLMELVREIKRTNHRVLIFSQSRKMLDIIERLLAKDFKYLRIDGTIHNPQDRQSRIMKFQKDSSITVFLLTTQVGGVGLTLTGADRVIIYDPCWNPATDAQAVDRVYRIGQLKPVVVYRLITCGTVEEKIYRRQIFKDSLTRQTTGESKNPYRYFTKEELRSLFALENPYSSQTQMQLEEMHGNQRRTDEELDSHLAFLMSLNVFGLSDHDLMFNCVEEEEALQDPNHIGHIKMQVEKAKEMVRKDAELLEKINKEGGNLQYREYTQERATKRLGRGVDTPYLPAEVLAAMGADLDDLQRYYNADENENQWLSTKPKTYVRSKPTGPPLHVRDEPKNAQEEVLITDTPDGSPSLSFRRGNESEIMLISESESEDEMKSTTGNGCVLLDSVPNITIEDSFERSADVAPQVDEPSFNPELDVSLQNLSAKCLSDDWFKDVDLKTTIKDKSYKRRSVAAFDLLKSFQPIREDSSRRRTMPLKEILNTQHSTNSKVWKPYSKGEKDYDFSLPSIPKVDDDDGVEMMAVSQRGKSKRDQMRSSLSRRSSSSSSELRSSLKAFHQPSISDFMNVKPSATEVNSANGSTAPRRQSVATPAGRRRSQLVTLDLDLNSSSDDDEDFKPRSASLSKVARPVVSEDDETEVEEVSLVTSDEEESKSSSLSSEPVNNYSKQNHSVLSGSETPSPHSDDSSGDTARVRTETSSKDDRYRGQDSVKLTHGDSSAERSTLAKFTPLRLPTDSTTPKFNLSTSPASMETFSSREDLQLSSCDEMSVENLSTTNRSSYDIEDDSPMAVVNRRKNARMVIDSDSDYD